MKHLFAILVLSFVLANVQAQTFNVNWGENAKLKYDYEDAVSLKDGKFIILKFKADRRVIQPILVLVDKNMETITESELPIEDKNALFKGFEKYGYNIFFMYESYNKEDKTTSVHAL